MNKIDFNLYLITDRHQTQGRPLKEVLSSAISGGVKAIQLREKDLPVRELLSLAFEIRNLTLSKALFFINDRIDVCQAVDADGIHLRSDSLPPSIVKKIVGEKKIIGMSCHSMEEALFAEGEGADFITLGPLFFTPSKKETGPPLGLQAFQSIIGKVSIPVFALGGIKMENLQETFQAGAKGVALISAISTSSDVQQSTKNFLERLQKLKI